MRTRAKLYCILRNNKIRCPSCNKYNHWINSSECNDEAKCDNKECILRDGWSGIYAIADFKNKFAHFSRYEIKSDGNNNWEDHINFKEIGKTYKLVYNEKSKRWVTFFD